MPQSISLRSLATVGGHTLLSRVLGFLRDVVIARLFGADVSTDAFLIAFKLPNLLRRLFVEGAFSLALIPVLSTYQQHSPATLKQFVDRLTGAMALFMIPITLLCMVAAPVIVTIFAPGFRYEPQRFWLTTAMLRISLPYLPLIAITACAGAILNSYKCFWVPAFTPVILNLCMIAAAYWLAPHLAQPITALAWGVLGAGVLQLAFQAPFLARLGLLPNPSFVANDPGVSRVWRLMGSALLGTSVTQLNLLSDTVLVSFLPVGSISWLYYANRLLEFPQGLLGVALGTVILPQLSACGASADRNGFSQTLDHALRGALLLGIPAALGLWILATPIMATLFQSEHFTARDVFMAAASLQAYAFGLPAYLVSKVFMPGYYARQDTHALVRITVLVAACNVAISLILIGPLAHLGLAWSSTLASSLNAILLWRGLATHGIYRAAPGWLALMVRIGIASAAMILVLELSNTETTTWPTTGAGKRLLNLVLWILAAGVGYGVVLFTVGFRMRHVKAMQ